MASTAWLSSDGDLVPAAIAGDKAAFDALVGPLIEPGYRLGAVMLRDGEEARDAVQDACLAMGFSDCANPTAIVNSVPLNLALVILPVNDRDHRLAA